MRRHIFSIFSIFLVVLIFFSSCTSVRHKKELCSRELLGTPTKTSTQLQNFFFSHNSNISFEQLSLMAQLYIEEASFEGINSDVAFVQMCLETGFLKFGNLVTPDMHNYCGLGSTGPENPGCVFENERLGVRAHIQHLQAYATTEETQLNLELIDPRYSWPHKAKFATTVFDLATNWATDPLYGQKLDGLLDELEYF